MRIPQPLRYRIPLLCLWVSFLVSTQLYAGQVVTEDLRHWATQVVQKEASLQLKSGANTVAVLYFYNRSTRPALDPLQKGMALMLITDLAKIEGLQVVERAQLQALAQELKLGASGLVDAETAPRVGRLLGARNLVGGQMHDLPADAIEIKTSVLDVPQNTALGEPTTNGILNDLIRMEKELLFEIIRLLRIEPTPEQEQELRKPLTMDIKALLYLFDGIHTSDQGLYEKAADNYRNALALDPALETAQSALDELLDLSLIQPPANSDAMLNRLHQQVSINTGPNPGQITKRNTIEPASVLGPGGSGSTDIRVQW